MESFVFHVKTFEVSLKTFVNCSDNFN